MDILIVLQQMAMIFILISIGIILFKKQMLSENTSTQISGIIVNVTNPALLVSSAFSEGPKASLQELGTAFAAFAAVYAVLIAAGFLIPYILRVPKGYHYAYQLLTIFGNVGFIGIPLAQAVLGPESLIYVSIYNLFFNILIYTVGIALLQKTKGEKSAAFRAKKLVNAGTISAAATVFFYLCDFDVPSILPSTLNYMGQATTLLSMLVLGVSVAQMTPRDIFSHPQLYGFTLLRQILLPVLLIMAFRPFIDNPLILSTLALMLAVPAANMPLMLSKQFHVETETISQGIILTTVLSLVTIPVVSLFL